MKLSLHTSPPSGDPSTSDSGDGRRDGDATATEMDSATAMRLQRDGDNDATATTGGGSRLRQHGSGGSGGGGGSATARQWWWRRWQLGGVGGGSLAAEWRQLSIGAAVAAWVAAAAPWHRWQRDGGSATARCSWWWRWGDRERVFFISCEPSLSLAYQRCCLSGGSGNDAARGTAATTGRGNSSCGQ